MTKEFKELTSKLAIILTYQQENKNFSQYERILTILLANFMWELKENDLKNTIKALRDLEHKIENGK